MKNLVQSYFDAFNAKDTDAMLACLSEDVAHHVNEGEIRRGRDQFAAFCAHMTRCYDEHLSDMVIFVDETGTRAAAEYIVNGTYLATDRDLPEARGQSYKLPEGSFFDIENGLITRVTTYYSLSGWLQQVQ